MLKRLSSVGKPINDNRILSNIMNKDISYETNYIYSSIFHN